jgi:hypothetical protein
MKILNQKNLKGTILEKLEKSIFLTIIKIENIDSTLVDNDGNKIHFISKYYCLFDKSLIIPKMYVWEDSSSDFITHKLCE